MPHPSDDPPSLPRAESVENGTPEASRPHAPAEKSSDQASPPSAVPQERDRRHRRRRRRRRPPQAPAPEPSVPATEAQAAEPAGSPLSPPLVGEGSVGAADAPESSSSPEPTASAAPPAQTPPRRRRRRRRGPPRAAPPLQEPATDRPQAETAEAVPDTGATAIAAAQDAARHELSPTAPRDMPPGQRRRPRRRPRPVREEGPPRAESEKRDGSETVVEVTSRSEPGTVRRVQIGRPRNRRAPDTRPREEGRRPGSQVQPTAPREERRERGTRERDGRDRSLRGRGSQRRGPGERRQARGRAAAQEKPERKLYALESVVDRGFEDVADDSEEGTTRRIHWTIVKRTVADQKSGKPMSAVYVLQREGTEAEFPNLGAARAAVNKTIVHPEKLTLSKAEHAQQRSNR